MDNGNYVRIDYDPDAPDDVSVTEVAKQTHTSTQASYGNESKSASTASDIRNDYVEMAEIERAATAELAEEVAKMMREEAEAKAEETVYETDEQVEVTVEAEVENVHTEEEVLEDAKTEETSSNRASSEEVSSEEVSSDEIASEEAAAEDGIESETESKEVTTEESVEEEPSSEELASEEPVAPTTVISDEVKEIMAEYTAGMEKMNRTMTRLERKFNDEILNAENRDSMVKTIYKELNDYKAGLVEKALKNVLYDLIDLRETMLSQMKYLKEKKGLDSISIDEFESYANDIGDILEKHDVTIYKGNPGEDNVAVRQKIVRKVPTEEPEMVKKVAESLSYGYEYNSKVIYPEKISIYIKK